MGSAVEKARALEARALAASAEKRERLAAARTARRVAMPAAAELLDTFREAFGDGLQVVELTDHTTCQTWRAPRDPLAGLVGVVVRGGVSSGPPHRCWWARPDKSRLRGETNDVGQQSD